MLELFELNNIYNKSLYYTSIIKNIQATCIAFIPFIYTLIRPAGKIKKKGKNSYIFRLSCSHYQAKIQFIYIVQIYINKN